MRDVAASTPLIIVSVQHILTCCNLSCHFISIRTPDVNVRVDEEAAHTIVQSTYSAYVFMGRHDPSMRRIDHEVQFYSIFTRFSLSESCRYVRAALLSVAVIPQISTSYRFDTGYWVSENHAVLNSEIRTGLY